LLLLRQKDEELAEAEEKMELEDWRQRSKRGKEWLKKTNPCRVRQMQANLNEGLRQPWIEQVLTPRQTNYVE
jgi:hypothetical protein